MVSRRWILYSFHISICLILSGLTLTLAQEDFWAQYCFESDNYTRNSAYRQSLDDALFGLTGTDNGYGFYNYSSGRQESQDHDSATAVALCRGDIPPDTCRRCVDDATRRLRQVCPVEKAATGWYDFCVLRYSNDPILNTVDHEIVFTQSNLNNVESVEQFNQTLSNLLDWLRGEAARGDSIRKYAAGTMNYTNGSGNSIIYGFMQCTPDLSESQCNQCLQAATEFIPVCCDSKGGGRVYGANCILRYEVYPFFNETWYPLLPILPAPGKERKSTFKLIFVPIAAAAVLTCVLVFLVCHSLHRNRRPKGKNVLPEVEAPLSNNSIESSKYQIDKDDSDEMNYFNLNTIQAATDNFSAANKLGEGGFGPVYKGTLPDGKEIAVKRLSRNSGQGLEEFRTEVRLIIKLQHKNLVRILGCCLKGSEKLLVYEYMANTSLDAFLFDPKKRKQLDWLARANIVIGIAKGLRYLHEDSRLKIVHRDMKASNILLDDEMNPKISDFGTARIFGGKQIEASTSRVVGTYGYMAPEYAMEGLFSTKSDIYSFGVLLLEIISGKKNSGFHLQDRGQFESLLSYAWCLWKDKKGEQLIDESLIGGCPVKEALRWINVGLLCVQEDPTARPTMSSVVFMLEGQTASLPQPSVPPFSVVRSTFFDQASTTGMQTVTLVSGRSSTTCTDTASTAPDQSEFRRNETS